MSAEASPQPAALTAFLSPTSRFLARKDDVQVAAAAAAPAAAAAVLSPADIAQKIASMLKPGPPFFSLVSSSDLIDQLGDASIMNCDFQRAAQAEADKAAAAEGAVSIAEAAPWTKTGTVWSALNSLPAGARFEQIPHSSSEAGFKSPQADDDDDGDDGLWSAMTISVDLDEETVHLEKSVVVPTQVLRQNHYWQGNSSALYSDIGAGQTYEWDDFAGQQAASTAAANSFVGMLSLYTPAQQLWTWPSWVPFLGHDQPAATPGGGQAKPAPLPKPSRGSKRVWVPSETRLSIHCSWWGFQLYLPPAIMAKLDGKAHSAEEIAKTIHKALTLILDKAGSLVLPLQLMAVLTILKAIAPVMGYIATFIGWSWDTIKSKDQGKGVVLAATWLLPVALIPRSWDAPTAPKDTNGDGSPDGAPIETTPPAEEPAPDKEDPATAPEVPAPNPAPSEPEQSVPAPAEPTPTPDAPSAPEEPAPSTPAPAEPEPTPTPIHSAPEPTPTPAVPEIEAPTKEAEEIAPVAEVAEPVVEAKEPIAETTEAVADELAAKLEAVQVEQSATTSAAESK